MERVLDGILVGALRFGSFIESRLELFLRLTQTAGQLGQLGATEQHQDDDQDDQEFLGAKVRHPLTLPAANR